MPVAAIVYLLAVNVLAFAAFAFDKARAIGGRQRVSERNLLMVALAGGSLGAVAAQRIVRHKTRKEPFRSYLNVIAGLHLSAFMIVAVVGLERTGHWIDFLVAAGATS